MEHEPVYPHIKVFCDTDDCLHLVTFTDKNKTGHRKYKHIGSGLIDFITLDLSKFERELNKANSQTELAYDVLRNLTFDVAELLKGKHDYVYFFLVGMLNNIFSEEHEQFKRCFDALYSVLELQKTFSFGVHLCLDIDNLPKYTMPEKFIGFVTYYEKYKNFTLRTGVRITPTYRGKLDFSVVESIQKKNITDTRDMLKEIHRTDKGAHLLNFTLIETLEEMLYFEFIELLKQGKNVKKCKLCGRYFVLSSRHETYFCDRKYTKNRTCKQVGAKQDYEKKVKNNPVLQEYQRIYKRYFARCAYGGKPFDKYPNSKFCGWGFEEWADLAAKLRVKYVRGEISGEELIKDIVG